ncbi:MAG: autotransporter domain-containing protein [Sphingomonas sp.]|nr:autotransporter domain-containing protein [Sphingomonas sp.]
MTNRRLLGRVLLGASALAAITTATPVMAQRVDTITAFGDSYADDGNAFQLGYANPQALAVYPTGRFSGGTNYIDTLGRLLNVPISNFAIGGAFGGTNNGTLCFDPFYAPGTSPLCGRGLQYEVDQFLNVGTQSTAFPSVPTTFGPGDLVTVSIGGNDARFYQQAGGTLALAPAAGAAAAVNTSLQLDRLVAAGAPTISFLAGDTGRLPEVAAQPTQAAIRSAYSASFNAGMQTTLAGYAADGVIVHYLDLNRVLDNVIANPAAYGITNGLVCPIFPNTTCVLNSSGYLFYGDALHLTSGGFEIVGQYIAAQLQAPLTLEAPSELGLDVARNFGRTLSTRVDLGSPRDGDVAEGLKLFVVGDTFSRDVNPTFATDGFDIDGVGGTAGVAYGFGTGVVGLAANYTKPRAKFIGDTSRTEGTSWQVGGFGGFAIAGAFAQGYLGYGWDDLDIDRQGVVEGMSAKTDGNHWLAGAKAGYLLPLGVMRAGPVVALDYAKAKVDGYTESGDPALTLNVSSVTAKSFTGGIGAELRGDFDTGGVSVRPYFSALLEKELADNDRVVRFAQTSAPGIVNSWSLGDRSKKAYGRLSGGGSAQILGNVTMNAVVSATVGRKDGNDMSAQVGLNLGF